MRLDGRVAVVTGGGTGLGETFAVGLAKEGAAVAVSDIDTDGAERVASEINGSGGSAIPYTLDVTDKLAIDAVMNQVEADFGQIDILVNNAGVRYIQPFMETSLDTWQRTIDII